MTPYVKSALNALANAVIRVLAPVMLPRKKGNLSPEKVKRVLVYGQMGIGNMIMFTPFLKALRRYFVTSEIVLLLLNKNGAEQVVEGSGLVDRIVAWDYQRMTYRQRLDAVRQFKRWAPDLVVSKFARNPVDLALIPILSRTPYRIGHVAGGGWEGDRDYLINYRARMKDNEHEIERHLHLASDAGIPTVDKKPVFHISAGDEDFARVFLKAHGIAPGEQFVAVQPGSSSFQSWKRWEAGKWAGLVENLVRSGIKVVAVGSADERCLIEDAFSGMAIRPVIAAGELTLKQTAAVIKVATLAVCNDSGLMHVAVAMDTPVVAIYGPGQYTRNAPRGDRHVVVRKDLTCSPCVTMKGTARVEACRDRVCLKSIDVDEVLEAVFRVLSRKSGELSDRQPVF